MAKQNIDKENENTLKTSAQEMRRSVEYTAQQVDYARSLGTELKDILGITENIKNQNKDLLGFIDKLTDSASQNNDLLRRQSQLKSRIAKDEKLYFDIQRRITQSYRDNYEIVDKLDKKTTAIREKEKVFKEAQEKERKAYLEFLKKQEEGDETALKNAKKAYDIQVERTILLGEELKDQYESLNVEEKKILVLKAMAGQLENITEEREKELGLAKEINKNLGIAGAIFSNLDKLGTRFGQSMGINLGVFTDAVGEAKDRMYSVAEAYGKLSQNIKDVNKLRKDGVKEDDDRIAQLKQESKEYAVRLVSQSKFATKYEQNEKRIVEIQKKGEKATQAEREEIQGLVQDQEDILEKVVVINEQLGVTAKTARVLASSFPIMKEAIKTMLMDVTTLGSVLGTIGKKILGGIKAQFISIDQSISDTARSLGVSREESFKLRNNLNDASFAANSIFVNAESMSVVLREIGEEYGLAVDKNGQLGEELTSNLRTLTRMKEEGKFSAENIQTMAEMYAVSGEHVDDILAKTTKVTVQASLQNKVNITTRKVLDGISQASANTRLHLSKNPEALAKASAAAIALGSSLKEIGDIAKGFLDFESSITAEMEAQIITGKEFSTAGLRYAYAFGTAEDQARELGNVMEQMNLTAEEWGKMNQFERDTLAGSLQMDDERLASMIARKEALGTLSEEAYNARRQEFMDLAKKTSIEEALSKMGEDELNRQFAQEANAEKMEAVQKRIANMMERIILPITENVGDVVVGWLENITAFMKPIRFIFDKLPLGNFLGAMAIGSLSIVAAVAALGLKGTPMMPMFVVDMSGKSLATMMGTFGKGIIGMAGSLIKIAAVLGAVLAVVETIKGMFAVFANIKKLGVGGAIESMGGVGVDAIRGATFGMADEYLESKGITAKGLSGTQTAMARAMYRKNNPEIGAGFPSNDELVADIKKRGAAGYTDDIYKAVTEVNDAIISNKGGLLVSGQKGMFKLNKQDSIVAGTDLLSSSSPSSSASGSDKIFNVLTKIKDLNEKHVGINQEHVNMFKTAAKQQLLSSEKGTKAIDAFTKGQAIYNTATGGGSNYQKLRSISALTGIGGKVFGAADKGISTGKRAAQMMLPHFDIDKNLDPEKADRLRKALQIAGSSGNLRDKIANYKTIAGFDTTKELFFKGTSNLAGSVAGGALGNMAGKGIGKMFKNELIGAQVSGLASQAVGKFATKQISKFANKALTKGVAGSAGGGLGGLLGGAGGGLAGGVGPALAALGPIAGIAAGAAGLFFGGRALIRKRKAAKERENERKQLALQQEQGIPSEELASSFTKLDEVRESGKKSMRKKYLKRAALGMALGGGIGLAVSQAGKKRGGLFKGLKGKLGGMVTPDIPQGEGTLVPDEMEMEAPDLMGDQLVPAPATGMYAGGAGSPAPTLAGANTMSSADVVAKLEELIKVVKSGTGIYMNGNKVGEAMVLSSTSMS